MDRRDFLKCIGVAAGSVGTTLAAGKAKAGGAKPNPDSLAILVDTTACIGCRSCEEACAERHADRGLAEVDIDDESVFEKRRDTTEKQWLVINRNEVDGEEIFSRRSCMHCNQPACATACLTKAMVKTPEGPVVYNADKCMGCRYCMLSCPFDIPKYEYYSINPKVQKCRMCFEFVKEGGLPACVDACPEEAIIIGKRSDLIKEGMARIHKNPDQYVHHIYGEHEAGGTGLLYLSAVPFEKLGMRTDLGTTAYPEYTKEFLYAVPVVFTLVPTFLLGLARATRDRAEEGEVE